MVPPVVAPGSRVSPSTPHQYGTRIRSNSTIKPSARLRQSPDVPPPPPRRIRPVPTPKSKAPPAVSDVMRPDWPPFPPEQVMLHSDDASSKVFLAIGRSFMSVDNCAMTIKDLAEMTMKFGLMCQNVSAAGQAITTYIRNHMQRCEVQQDHPLLLRHVLSGTSSDDDLVSALHSRTGGAHCMLNPSDTRITNFRRGTMVWYLSKAAGAPCPFARAGIRLSDYSDSGKAGAPILQGKDKKRERDRMRRAEQCGQKRKRLLRACADKGSDSDSSEDDRRPPKVKLTLRLRPPFGSPCDSSSGISTQPESVQPEIIDLSRDDGFDSDRMSSDSDSDLDSDSDSDAMSVESSDVEVDSALDYPILDAQPRGLMPFPACTSFADGQHVTVDRLSVFHSESSASPPPDSEDEDEQSHTSANSPWRSSIHSRLSSDDEDEDMDYAHDWFDLDGDAETRWESPGPRSPSAQFEDEIVVKQEPSDVGEFLDAWDDLDSKNTCLRVIDVIAQAAAGLSTEVKPKVEDSDSWTFQGLGGMSIGDALNCDIMHVKQEEIESQVSFLVDGFMTPPPECPSPTISISPVAPSLILPASYTDSMLEACRNSDFEWRDAEVLGPDSVDVNDLDEGVWQDGCSRYSNVSHEASPVTENSGVDVNNPAVPAHVPVLPPRLDLISPLAHMSRLSVTPDLPSPSLLTSLTSLSLRSPTTLQTSQAGPSSSPQTLSEDSCEHVGKADEYGVLHMCQPGAQAITAKRFEGITVYQMSLESSLVLRRYDTDFVNVSSLVIYLGVSIPDESNAVVVVRGSPSICGTWVSLMTAQEMFKDRPELTIFLSNQLSDCFPQALHGLTHSNPMLRSRDHFGPNFQSTVDANRHSLSSQRIELPPSDFGWDKEHVDADEHLISMHPVFVLASAMLPTPAMSPEEIVVAEAPLSPTEEEIFRVLCPDRDWEEPTSIFGGDSARTATINNEEKDWTSRDRPLRRSRRVADAIANRSRTRSNKRGSRSSQS
ncbi:uncharacterized protein FIBRA_00962 [Fibroporia radiculosa]|uniref:Uncharacterized protein n=1 Tax=Fibroporia radiculosa TaxID=599839 RepID=J4H0U4_9APHY|nr:uncharacterized protein FIBRA_00962 [Fibroporia radiculosa]CCL98954.1 predicted protein [Fibroporia radiculosa]